MLGKVLAPLAGSMVLAAFMAPAAADERELQLALEPMYALVHIAGEQGSQAIQASGGGGVVQLSYGLNDNLYIQLLGGLSAHPGIMPPPVAGIAPAQEQLLMWQASVGVLYALDVVRVVPFFEAAVGLLGVTRLEQGGPQTALNAGFSLGVGGDYLITRRVSAGVALRYFVSLNDPATLPLYLTVGPRLNVRWEL